MAMNAERLSQAIDAAQEFLDLARTVRIAAKVADDQWYFSKSHKETAALKRKSMDLTNALVELRRERR